MSRERRAPELAFPPRRLIRSPGSPCRGDDDASEAALGRRGRRTGGHRRGDCRRLFLPRTPATEVFEYIEGGPGSTGKVSALWSANEKVAYEEAVRVMLEADEVDAVVDSGPRYDPLVHALRVGGVPVFPSADQAIRSLGRYLCHRIGGN